MWRTTCGAADTAFACHPDPKKAGGGQHALHPLRAGTTSQLESVGGPEFTPIQAELAVLPKLPAYLPQLRNRTSLHGHLVESIYAVRGKEVIGARRSVLPAPTFRKSVGLSRDQRLVLLLFDDDAVLERLWRDGEKLLPQIAAAGYDIVVCPSYSTWLPRPRPDFMFSAKRSLVTFAVLQRLGVPAVLRLAWVIDHDVQRAAEWVRENSMVDLIALDLQTYAKNPREYAEQLEHLRRFDRLTRRRLRYLINGPTSKGPVEDLFSVVPDSRVCITNATMSGPFEDSGAVDHAQLRLGPRDRSGVTFAPRCELRRATIRSAAQSALVRRRQGRGDAPQQGQLVGNAV